MATMVRTLQQWGRMVVEPRRKVALVGLVVVLLFGTLASFASTVQAASGKVSHPVHHTDPRQNATSIIHPPFPRTGPPFTAAKQPVAIPRPGPAGTQPVTTTLSATTALHLVTSDGRLSVAAPAGLFTASQITQVGGVQAHLSQIAPGAGSSAGGSGVVSFGTFLLSFTDAKGNGLPFGPSQPVTISLHYASKEMAFDLDQAYVILNGSIPRGTVVGQRGAYQSVSVTHDRTAHTLSITLPAAPDLAHQPGFTHPLTHYPPTTYTFNTNSRVAIFGSPSAFNVDLNAGALTDGVQLAVPPGPGGTLPNITLAYSSAGVSEQHDPQGAASWVGEGWNLSLGAITWAEHNVQQNSGGSRWQNSWRLTDPFGTSDELIPNATNVSTYYDDTTGNQFENNTEIWHTASESHIKIYSQNSGLNIGMPTDPPCFRVFLQNGIMEEFGCTFDSLEYYYVPGNGDYVYGWLLDLITNPTGNQVQLTYQRDLATISYNGQNYTYPRDSELQSIAWDSPTCYGYTASTTGCPTAAQGGTSPNLWAPLDQVVFNASHTPSNLTNTPSGCNTGTNLRCDDSLDLSGSGGIGVPAVINTFVLNTAQVQVNNSGTWHTLRSYSLYYEQGGPSTHTDPVTGKSESMAGMLDLTRIKELGDDGSTAYPTTVFSYQTVNSTYVDSTFDANPPGNTNCGPTWNTGCVLWSQSYDNNSRYLASAYNGEGLNQTFQWALARSNTHGTPTGSHPADPLYCTNAGPSVQAAYPCDAADDQAWSRAVVTQRDDVVERLSQNGQGGQQTTTPVDSEHTYSYSLQYPLAAQECGDCVAGMYWGNQNDGDYLDYYNTTPMGFAQTEVSNPDGSTEYHKFYTTQGLGVFDTSQVMQCLSNLPPVTQTCHASPWWNVNNAAHGHEYEADYYDTNGSSFLKQVKSTDTATCPPSGVSGSPPVSGITWDGNLVSELDSNNPVAVCDVELSQQVTNQFDGITSQASTLTTTYTYDSYGTVTATTKTSNGGTPGTTVDKTAYTWYDGLNPTIGGTGVVSGTYLIDLPAYTDTEDSSSNRLVCHEGQYDELGYGTGSNSSLKLGQPTASNSFDTCGTSGTHWTPTGQKQTSQHYDGYGNATSGDDADANAGDSSHQGCTVSGKNHTVCTVFDGTTQAKSTSGSNAKNQANSSSYGSAPYQSDGWQQWLISSTDANGNTTSYTYDALGRQTSITEPGETSGDTTQSMSYTNWCGSSGPQTPCVEEDSTQRLDNNTVVTTRNFYDGYHHLVETRTPGPNNQDVVTYTYYDTLGRGYASSIKYFVTAYTGSPGSAAYSIPDSTVATSQTTAYDGLSRTLTAVDAISEQTSMGYSIVCSPVSGDTGCYEQTQTTDANRHRTASLADAMGHQTYIFTYTGTNPYTLYATTKFLYDVAGRKIEQDEPGGKKATWQYDAAGRVTQTTDPDQGTLTMVYDANGNLVEASDPRGTGTGTVWYCYDGLDRKTKMITGDQCSSSPTLASWSYDSTTGGMPGIGHLTSEAWNSNGGAGSDSYVFDDRGQQVGWTATFGSSNYNFSFGFNDAGMPTTLTYPDGTVLTASYTSQGWPSSAMVNRSGTNTTLVNNIGYSGTGGAAMEPTSASIANGTYAASYSYDTLARLTSIGVTNVSTSATEFSQSRGYDSVGNVTSVNTTLPAGTDNQAFCYDEFNRLVWAGSTGTPSCGASLTEGSLTSAAYTQSYAYDANNRLTTGPAGAYTYGNSSFRDAVTSTSGGYGAAYDGAGDMNCRAPTSSQTCSGTQTGQPVTYDQLRRILNWQNAASNPTANSHYAYDGEGNRVIQNTTINGTNTVTYYLGSYEEVAVSGSTTNTTKYYAAGAAMATDVNGTLTYLINDGLGNASASLDTNGNELGADLYLPYGGARYTNGSLSTTKGFTGQLQDPSGLDYFHARYYDPTVGQFATEDTVQGPNRYAYVAGNPESATDPTGQYISGGAGCYDPYQCTAFVTGTKTNQNIFFDGQQQSTDAKCKGKTAAQCDKSAVQQNPWVCIQDFGCFHLLDFVAGLAHFSINAGEVAEGIGLILASLIIGVGLTLAINSALQAEGVSSFFSILFGVDPVAKLIDILAAGVIVAAHGILSGLYLVIQGLGGMSPGLSFIFGTVMTALDGVATLLALGALSTGWITTMSENVYAIIKLFNLLKALADVIPVLVDTIALAVCDMGNLQSPKSQNACPPIG